MTEQQFASIADAMLEVIDNSENGISLFKIEEVMMRGISYTAFIKAANWLWWNKLIVIDANHIAHRVRT